MAKSSTSASRFCPTKFDSAAQKEKFVKHFLRFVEKDFPESLFYKWFYNRLSNTFGHIAHYSKSGFYGTFFTTTADKIRFLRFALNWPCYGDPAFTYSDVEKVLQNIIREKNYLDKYEKQLVENVETQERAELARLKAKYEK